jgi:hypothetical protein
MRPFVWHPQTNPFPKTKVDRFNRKKPFLKMLSPLPLNSLTANSVPAGTKLVLFGRYVLNIYVGIV